MIHAELAFIVDLEFKLVGKTVSPSTVIFCQIIIPTVSRSTSSRVSCSILYRSRIARPLLASLENSWGCVMACWNDPIMLVSILIKTGDDVMEYLNHIVVDSATLCGSFLVYF